LAKTIDISDEGRFYTFNLRDDARFHDGRVVEPEDVRFSLTRAIHPATAGGDLSQLSGPTYLGEIVGARAVMAGETDELEGVETVDTRTVRITLMVPSSTFLMKLAAMPAAILDRHQDMSESDWWTSINGSGPYRLAAFDAGSGMSLKAVEAWHGGDVPVKDISIRLGVSAGQPVNLFQAGEIDLVPEVPPALVSLVSDPATGMEEAFVLEQPEFALSYIAFGNQRPPLDDVHIRRALQKAYPASQFARAAFDGRVRIAEGVIPPGMLGREWPAQLPGIDIEAARKEIVVSVYGDAASVPSIRVHAADIAPVEALRDVIRDELGLHIEAVQVNWFDFLNGLSNRRWDAYGLFWGVDYPDPEALLQVLFGTESGENYTGYSNLAFDDLMTSARHETDDVKRQEIYAEAQQLLIDDAAVIPMYVPVRYTLARRGMTHVPVTAMGILGLEALS
jgi:ABC-type transport system substrate-binding protein